MPEVAYASVQSLSASEISAGGAAAARLGFHPTPALALKAMLSCAFGAATVYYLHTGRRDADMGKLLWAGVFGVLTFLVFAI